MLPPGTCGSVNGQRTVYVLTSVPALFSSLEVPWLSSIHAVIGSNFLGEYGYHASR